MIIQKVRDRGGTAAVHPRRAPATALSVESSASAMIVRSDGAGTVTRAVQVPFGLDVSPIASKHSLGFNFRGCKVDVQQSFSCRDSRNWLRRYSSGRQSE